MQITFTGQESTFKKTAKGGYSQMEISYLDERGGNKTWKIFSFSNPKVFDTFKNAKPNTIFEITTRKNDKDFTEWASAEPVGEASAVTASTTTKAPSVSQYETRDERNTRQRLIVRQSCLAQAIAYFQLQKEAPNHMDMLSLADEFVAWVFEAPSLMEIEEPSNS